tara:strand:+ start:537 stop:737 length:201 start_codon:yes stop_codon:yes gene_type:complete
MLKLVLQLGSQVIPDLSRDASLQAMLLILDAQRQTVGGISLRKISARKGIVGGKFGLIVNPESATK